MSGLGSIVALVTVLVASQVGTLGTPERNLVPSPDGQPLLPDGGIPPLTSYNLTIITRDELLAATVRGEPLDLVLGGNPVSIALRLNDMRDPSFKLVDTVGLSNIVAYPPATYKGWVIGEPRSEGRFGLGAAGLEGYVRIQKDMYFVEPLSKYRGGPAEDAYVVYRTDEFKRAPTTLVWNYDIVTRGADPDAVAAQGPPRTSSAPSFNGSAESSSRRDTAGSGTTSAWSPSDPSPTDNPVHYFTYGLVARIMLSADQEYRAAHPDWQFQMELTLNLVEGIYAKGVGIEFRIVREDAVNLASTNMLALRDEYAAFENSDPSAVNTARNLAHLFTGKNVLYPLCDGALGVSYPGGLETAVTPMPPNFGYSVSMTEYFLNYCFWYGTWYERMVVAAHEMGHLFNADHPFAVEDPPGSGAYTLMKGGIPPINTQAYFSDGTNDPSKDNVHWIREFAPSKISSTYANNVAAWPRSGATPAASCGSPDPFNHGSERAFDEDVATYWWAGSTPCSLVSYFASTFRITKFAIRELSSSYLITSFNVYAILPDDTEVLIHSNTAATQTTYILNFRARDAKGIRLDVQAVCCGNTAAVTEFEAYASENLASQAFDSVAFSSGDLWGHTPDQANDGNLVTYWWADRTPSELYVLLGTAHATALLGGPFYVSQIVVRAFAASYALQDWSVWVKEGGTWRMVVRNSPGWPAVVTIFVVTGTPWWIMGIKLVVEGPVCCGGVNTFAVIREIEAYADNSEPATARTEVWVYSEN